MEHVHYLAPASGAVRRTGLQLLLVLFTVTLIGLVLPGIAMHPFRFFLPLPWIYLFVLWLRKPRLYVLQSGRLIIRYGFGSRSWDLRQLCSVCPVDPERAARLRMARPFPALFGYRGIGFDSEQGSVLIQSLTLQNLLQLHFQRGPCLWLAPATTRIFINEILETSPLSGRPHPTDKTKHSISCEAL